MYVLRSFFNTAVIGTSAIVWLFLSGVVAAPFLWLFGDKKGHLIHRFVYCQSKGIMLAVRMCSNGWRVERSPRPKGPCIVAANHASALDLYSVCELGFNNVVYITKGWVFKIPFFRFVMNGAGYIDAEKTPPEQMLELCGQAVKNGCDIVLFPQGSRKNPQARFKSGAFYLAEKLNLPVVPMAICGTGKMLPSGSKILRPANIVLKSFPAVFPSDFGGDLGHLKMAQAVKKQIMDFVNSEESK